MFLLKRGSASAPSSSASAPSSSASAHGMASSAVEEMLGGAAADKMERQGTVVSGESVGVWMKRILDVQANKITPKMRRQMLKKARRQQKAMLQQRKCKKMQSASRKSAKAWSSAMRTPTALFCSAAASGRAELQALQLAVQNTNAEDVFGTRDDGLAVEVSSAVLEQEDEEEALEEASVVSQTEVQDALENLRKEPDNDEERECKFGLYTSYLETVESLRAETLSFWQESKSEFEPPAARLIERQIADIDCEANMSMADFSSSRWFVYDMCHKVQQNRDKINAVLRSIRTKLDLMSRQDECPMCLDKFDEERVPKYLSCCHAVCEDCWAHWKEVNRRPFCPLCRGVEFCEHVVTQFDARHA